MAVGRPADVRQALMVASVSAAMTWLPCAVPWTGISALTTMPPTSSERRRAESAIERTTLSAAPAVVKPDAATTDSRNLRCASELNWALEICSHTEEVVRDKKINIRS
jgi:hypothetical protein